MKLAFPITFFVLTLFIIACSNSSDVPEDEQMEPEGEQEENEDNLVSVTYVADDADFANPERGFYRYSETLASNYTVLDENQLRGYRTSSVATSANYTTLSTLVFRYYVLDAFVTTSISADFLEKMEQDFSAARNAGVKLIPRFTYTTTANSGSCPAGFICPPYGDASKEIVLGHIGQLSQVLTTNVDVIHCIQMGFIGTWGENYYTDYFGDASNNATQGKLLDENWQDRIDVLKALLDATPKEVMIQARYPQMKQRYVYGINAETNVAAMLVAEAFTETDKARIGFHNDCLFASADDFGTYADYGNTSSSPTTDIANLKSYFADDSKYVVVGGETCTDAYSPENDCAPSGMADTDLRALHYTFLNMDYNNEVNNDWTDGGCMEDIKRNLGYRFALQNATFSSVVAEGGAFEVTLQLENSGYASSVKERNVIVILRNKTSNEEISLSVDTDVRLWFTSETITADLQLPSSAVTGEYDVYLHIADIHERIAARPEYSLRLANTNVWEEATGYNNLNHVLTIQ
ncbi:DUF4832 domain-containing protein [Maribacter sp.]|nr:DUF4832 domain-containing protein [Maribacter sp.]